MSHPKDDQYYKLIFIALSKVKESEHEKKFQIMKNLRNIFKRAKRRAELLEDFHYYCYWEDSPQLVEVKQQLTDHEEKLIRSFEALSPFMDDLKKIDKKVVEFVNKISSGIKKEEDGK